MLKKHIGIIGGGQLGRMIAQANEMREISHLISAVNKNPSPICKYLNGKIIDLPFNSSEGARELAKLNPNIVTIEVEHVDCSELEEMEKRGIQVYPSSKTVRIIQDKFLQYQFLIERGFKVPQSTNVTSRKDLESLAFEKYMLKERKGGFDGRGNRIFENRDEIDEILEYFKDRPFMAQEFFPFEKELSVIVARNQNGEIRTYDVAENIHRKSILEYSIVPARIGEDIKTQAQLYAIKAVETFEDVGVFAVEMFYSQTQGIAINEIAPRVHNSGHWSLDQTAKTSQFEQHLRAITGEELGDTTRNLPVVMVNILGEESFDKPADIILPTVTSEVKTYTHLYGKTSKPDRKLGHINLVGSNPKIEVEHILDVARRIKKETLIVPEY